MVDTSVTFTFCYTRFMVTTPKKQSSFTLSFVNFFGTLGYMSVILQWLWVVVLYGPALMDTPLKQLFFPPEGEPIITPPVHEAATQSPLTIALAVGITIIVLAITIYVIIKAPSAVGKTGKKVTHSAAKAVIPVITKHKPIKKEFRRKLTIRITALSKMFLVIIPLVGILPVQFLSELPVSFDIILIITVVNALLSLLFFGLQYAMARVFRTQLTVLW